MHTPGSLGGLLVHLLNAPQPDQLVRGACDGKPVLTTHQSARPTQKTLIFDYSTGMHSDEWDLSSTRPIVGEKRGVFQVEGSGKILWQSSANFRWDIG